MLQFKDTNGTAVIPRLPRGAGSTTGDAVPAPGLPWHTGCHMLSTQSIHQEGQEYRDLIWEDNFYKQLVLYWAKTYWYVEFMTYSTEREGWKQVFVFGIQWQWPCLSSFHRELITWTKRDKKGVYASPQSIRVKLLLTSLPSWRQNITQWLSSQ